MNEDKFSKSIDDAELDEVAGGFKGDYQQVYRLLKENGAVSGNVRDFAAISKGSEKEKVEDVLSDIFGGTVEIGTYEDKENVYWKDGKLMLQNDVVKGIKAYYAEKNSADNIVFK